MAVASMTGFARSVGQHGSWQWSWEAKSVNARSRDIRFRAPQGHEMLDIVVREAISKRFQRGAFSVNLGLSRTGTAQSEVPMRINSDLLDMLVEEARRYQGRVSPDAPRIEALLAVRGVVEAVETPESEEDVAARLDGMAQSLGEALDALAEARQEEGDRLAVVLSGQLADLEALRAEAASVESLRPEKVKERWTAQLKELLDAVPTLPEERLAQELAILTVKGDIREELDRLSSHFASAGELLSGGGAIGRRLDFLCQEMTREANTICSKSNDVDLTRVGLDMKATVEQFREQVQNLE